MFTGVPARHRPVELQVSLPLQAFPSEQLEPLGRFACVIAPVVVLQLSVVQGLPSSMTGGVPATQVPPELHVSAPLQALLSEQLVPAATGVCVTPPAGVHASVVQGLLSFTGGAVPATQVPLALQVSLPLQRFESAQLVPLGTGVCTTPVPGTKLSVVHGLPSSTGGIVQALAPPPAGA
jgi:hypothetical protein